MPQHMLTPPEIGFVDPRRSDDGASVADDQSRLVGEVIFTTNAAGTTTTAVGATASNGTNAVRVGERFKIFDSNGDLKEETVFTVSSVTTGASDTVTFTPAAAAAPGSGSTLRLVGPVAFVDNDSLDARLVAIGYSQADCDKMTQNDKVYALRVNDDPGSF